MNCNQFEFKLNLKTGLNGGYFGIEMRSEISVKDHLEFGGVSATIFGGKNSLSVDGVAENK